MDMDRDNLSTNRTNTPHTTYDRDTVVPHRERGGSNFLAFLIGGLVIAVGLLAFLFYDGGSTDVNTTGSTAPRIESPAAPPVTSPSTTAPATPTTPRPGPAAPPANPQ